MLDVLFNGFLHLGFVLVLGLATLGLAVSFASSPGERKLGMLRPLSVATVFSISGSLAAGVGATLRNGADVAGSAGTVVTGAIFAGLAETMVPALVGFSLLALAWLLTAVGLRRQI